MVPFTYSSVTWAGPMISKILAVVKFFAFRTHALQDSKRWVIFGAEKSLLSSLPLKTIRLDEEEKAIWLLPCHKVLRLSSYVFDWKSTGQICLVKVF